MNEQYLLTVDDLFSILKDWNSHLNRIIFLAACGGTALTLQNYKESTKDVVFLVPIPEDYNVLVKMLIGLDYEKRSAYGFKHPGEPWIFDLFAGQLVYQTELLDPIHEDGNHKIIRRYKNLTLACLNPFDLIISKIFRGTLVDEQDSVLVAKSEELDLEALVERYIETAGYFYNPTDCKSKLGLLINALSREGLETVRLEEMMNEWTP